MKRQKDLFNNLVKEDWEKEWQEMPEFKQDDKKAHRQLIVSFRNQEDLNEFLRLIKQRITNKTKSIWFPLEDKDKPSNYLYSYFKDEDVKKNELPKYPIYIISKGRAESRLTSKALDEMNVHYFIVIEPQEYKEYSKYIDESQILVLPFSNLDKGSIPARNFVFEDSIKRGFKRHWILDDNIGGFIRLNRNRKIKVNSPVFFKIIEDFVDRYENIALAGPDYRYFAPERETKEPFILNTRVYSCILIDNSIPFRWRGKYNEDTDLSLRVLKAGYCTILFKAFLCNKVGTLKMKGGNTDNVYIDNDKRLKFAQSLMKQHPDVTKIVQRYNRFHHEVDYRSFNKNKLKRKENLNLKNEVNNYGLRLIKIK